MPSLRGLEFIEIIEPTRENAKLQQYPERYSGFTRNGELVAYVKQNDWTTIDEFPFTPWYDVLDLAVQRLFRMDTYTGMWGIFGLVAADDLGRELQRGVLAYLLGRSVLDAASGKKRRLVNVVMHENDPLLQVAMDRGFVALGRRGEAVGAPGLKQRRYQLRQISR